MINIGSIGSGTIVKNMLSTMKKVDGYELIGFYSRDINKANEFKKEFEIKYAYDDLEEMLSNDEINTIYIASPNSLHYEQAKKALLNEKNVICEKPFTSRVSEAEELISIARKNKLNIFEAISNVYLPLLNRVKKEIENIGKISSVIVNFSQYSSKYDRYLKGDIANVFRSEFSGGALADLGIYNLHLIYHLFGNPKDLNYFGNINEYGVDMSGVASFKYDDFVVNFTCAKDTFSKNFIDIQGDKGYIFIDNTLQAAKKMVIYKDGSKEEIVISDNRMYEYELEYFRNNFDNVDGLIKDNENSIEVLKIFEKLKKSGNIRDSIS